jgi:hypothetical protein
MLRVAGLGPSAPRKQKIAPRAQPGPGQSRGGATKQRCLNAALREVRKSASASASRCV